MYMDELGFGWKSNMTCCTTKWIERLKVGGEDRSGRLEVLKFSDREAAFKGMQTKRIQRKKQYLISSVFFRVE